MSRSPVTPEACAAALARRLVELERRFGVPEAPPEDETLPGRRVAALEALGVLDELAGLAPTLLRHVAGLAAGGVNPMAPGDERDRDAGYWGPENASEGLLSGPPDPETDAVAVRLATLTVARCCPAVFGSRDIARIVALDASSLEAGGAASTLAPRVSRRPNGQVERPTDFRTAASLPGLFRALHVGARVHLERRRSPDRRKRGRPPSPRSLIEGWFAEGVFGDVLDPREAARTAYRRLCRSPTVARDSALAWDASLSKPERDDLDAAARVLAGKARPDRLSERARGLLDNAIRVFVAAAEDPSAPSEDTLKALAAHVARASRNCGSDDPPHAAL